MFGKVLTIYTAVAYNPVIRFCSSQFTYCLLILKLLGIRSHKVTLLYLLFWTIKGCQPYRYSINLKGITISDVSDYTTQNAVWFHAMLSLVRLGA